MGKAVGWAANLRVPPPKTMSNAISSLESTASSVATPTRMRATADRVLEILRAEGEAAHRRGLDHFNNPCCPGSAYWAAWSDGWNKSVARRFRVQDFVACRMAAAALQHEWWRCCMHRPAAVSSRQTRIAPDAQESDSGSRLGNPSPSRSNGCRKEWAERWATEP
jgi:hypothetical protein